MESKKGKYFKPLMIRVLAVFMSVCYVLTPLHQQINTVLHSISHFLEVPVDVMSHNQIEFFEGHQHVNHYSFKVDHEHNLIDFLHSIFKASDNEDRSQESLATKLKIDKHFISSDCLIKRSLLMSSKNSFFDLVRPCIDGYSWELYAPPRLCFEG